MHLIQPQMPFFNMTLLLLGQPSEYFSQMPSQPLLQCFPAAFQNKHNIVAAIAK
jgi:hypothetical protein